MCNNFGVEHVRAFIAIELNEELRAALGKLQQALKLVLRNHSRAVRWVQPANIHLTLKFFGSVEEPQIPSIIQTLEQSVRGIAPFDLTARTLGCFPNTRRPNNIWVGLDGDVEPLTQLARALDTHLAALGFESEARPFSPHLTLARIKRDAAPSDRATIGQTISSFSAPSLGTIDVDRVHLIQSDLRPSGPLYTTLATARLVASR